MTHINDPLVSVCVYTYNSAKYLIETLESAKNQTYQRIELVISDDGSTDDSVAVARTWLEANKDRFINTELITVELNTGVSANTYRGVDAAAGYWIKIIAGDDLLMEDCIENYITHAKKNTFDWAVARMRKLRNNVIENHSANQNQLMNFFKLNTNARYLSYLINPIFLNPPTGFYKASLLKNKGTIDVAFTLLEDQPIFLDLLRTGKVGVLLDKDTVIYRINESSITGKVNKKFYQNLLDCYHKYREPFIPNTFLGILYKKSIEGRFRWLINDYTGKNKFGIIKSILWEKFNIWIAGLTIKRVIK